MFPSQNIVKTCFLCFFYKITPKLQNKGPKKGKIDDFADKICCSICFQARILLNFAFFLRSLVKTINKYALTSVLLLNSLAGAFALEKMTFCTVRCRTKRCKKKMKEQVTVLYLINCLFSSVAGSWNCTLFFLFWGPYFAFFA